MAFACGFVDACEFRYFPRHFALMMDSLSQPHQQQYLPGTEKSDRGYGTVEGGLLEIAGTVAKFVVLKVTDISSRNTLQVCACVCGVLRFTS